MTEIRMNMKKIALAATLAAAALELSGCESFLGNFGCLMDC